MLKHHMGDAADLIAEIMLAVRLDVYQEIFEEARQDALDAVDEANRLYQIEQVAERRLQDFVDAHPNLRDLATLTRLHITHDTEKEEPPREPYIHRVLSQVQARWKASHRRHHNPRSCRS